MSLFDVMAYFYVIFCPISQRRKIFNKLWNLDPDQDHPRGGPSDEYTPSRVKKLKSIILEEDRAMSTLLLV